MQRIVQVQENYESGRIPCIINGTMASYHYRQLICSMWPLTGYVSSYLPQYPDLRTKKLRICNAWLVPNPLQPFQTPMLSMQYWSWQIFLYSFN